MVANQRKAHPQKNSAAHLWFPSHAVWMWIPFLPQHCRRAGCIPFHRLQCRCAWCIPFYRGQGVSKFQTNTISNVDLQTVFLFTASSSDVQGYYYIIYDSGGDSPLPPVCFLCYANHATSFICQIVKSAEASAATQVAEFSAV